MNAPMVSLSARVRSLLGEAARSYQGRPAGRQLAEVAAHLDGPLRVAIAGRVKAGKSTLLNALVGTRVAATDAGECTKVVTWYARGASPAAHVFPRGRRPIELALAHADERWTWDLGDLRAEDVDRVEVGLPSEWLNRMTLVDTPGMGSLTESAGRRTEEFLGETGVVDAVLYLLRHLHSSDVDFLDAFNDNTAGETNPVNAIGVLSRADEVGGGGPDSLDHAAKVAAEYRSDSRLRGLVHTVLPVAGLLAETGATLNAADFAELARLADAGLSATMPLLLSAARFTSETGSVPVSPAVRRRLLDQLGIYGMRFALDAVRNGARTVEQLHAELLDRSGLAELRALLLSQFAQRRDVLKADGALRTIESVARIDPIPATPRILQAVERLRAGAHELTEIRLLTELRMGMVSVPPGQLAAMERLLGGQGGTMADRLKLAPGTSADTATAVIAGLHGHWQRVAQNRLTDPNLARAARVLQRTCEGLSSAAMNRQVAPPEPPTQRMAAPGAEQPTHRFVAPPDARRPPAGY
jgi:hypothetical protein